MPREKTAPPLAGTAETGSLGIRHVKRLWSRTLAKRISHVQETIPPEDWVKDNTLVCGLRLGLRETTKYLYDEQPSFEQFENWILKMSGGVIDKTRTDRLNAALSGELREGPPPEQHDLVFTSDEIVFWEENGYIVLHDAIPPEGCRDAVDAICQFLQMDLNAPDTWYGGPQGHSIWIPLLHHPAIEANRQSPRIHKAFA